MSAVLRHALARLGTHPGRALLAAGGIAAAAAMVGAAITVGYGLATGFDRSVRAAGLPDEIARFEPRSAADVDARVRGLAKLRDSVYRLETLSA